MKKILAVSLVCCSIASISAFAADKSTSPSGVAPVIAVVNVQEIFQQSPRIADLNKKLQNQFKPRQDKLIAAQKATQDELDKFKKDSVTMSAKDKDKMQKKISDDQDALSKDAAAFQQDLGKEQKKILGGVQSDLNNIISSISKENGYNLVLDAQAVVFISGNNNDITKDVMKKFDASK